MVSKVVDAPTRSATGSSTAARPPVRSPPTSASTSNSSATSCERSRAPSAREVKADGRPSPHVAYVMPHYSPQRSSNRNMATQASPTRPSRLRPASTSGTYSTPPPPRLRCPALRPCSCLMTRLFTSCGRVVRAGRAVSWSEVFFVECFEHVAARWGKLLPDKDLAEVFGVARFAECDCERTLFCIDSLPGLTEGIAVSIRLRVCRA